MGFNMGNPFLGFAGQFEMPLLLFGKVATLIKKVSAEEPPSFLITVIAGP